MRCSCCRKPCGLNESPSEKEGKFGQIVGYARVSAASMKALPKRKGNLIDYGAEAVRERASMKALPKRKGNTRQNVQKLQADGASMKALPKRKGNVEVRECKKRNTPASMKALPKRKGNTGLDGVVSTNS